MSSHAEIVAPTWSGDRSFTASTPLTAHACNCVGCCRRCGTCSTWFGHTPAYCDMIVRQQGERARFVQNLSPAPPAPPAVTHTGPQ